MTDVADWTGVAAGPARIASVQNFTLAPGASRTFNVPLTFTDRSLVLLGNQGINGGFSTTQISVTGHTTATNYLQAQWWQGLFPTSDLPPLTVPAYGVADASVDVTVKNNTGGTNLTYQIWVVAVPDEVMVGSSADPIAATPGGQPLGPPGAVTGINSSTPYDTVALIDPTTGLTAGLVGVHSNPLPTTARDPNPATAHSLNLVSGSGAILLAAPAVGKCWEIVQLAVQGGATAAGQFLGLLGLTTGVNVGAPILATGAGSFAKDVAMGAPIYLAEGVKVNGNFGSSNLGQAIARQVTLG